MASSFLALDRLNKRFGDQHVIRDLSLEVSEGEILALLGPSGSGKTTLLRLLAGFETPDSGEIVVGGEDVAGQSPARRRFGMVFQHYALFPHLTVGENVAFGLEARDFPAAERRERIARMLDLVDLVGFEGRRVGEISGGQQQRVALARALAPDPKLLLLDEPLSNLDPMLRERTRRELAEAIREIGITTVLVTHEQEEAFDLGDRVAVLHQGLLEQVGPPEVLYGRPATPFVATFVGHASVLAGEWAPGGVRLAPNVLWRGDLADGETVRDGETVDWVVRPESLALSSMPSSSADPAESTLAGEVVDRKFMGPLTYYRVALERGGSEAARPELEVLAPADAAKQGDAVRVELRPDGLVPRVFPQRRISP
ncbi:MAG: ABC transporter ATP-binding protein [Acidobacteriota bacterium]